MNLPPNHCLCYRDKTSSEHDLTAILNAGWAQRTSDGASVRLFERPTPLSRIEPVTRRTHLRILFIACVIAAASVASAAPAFGQQLQNFRYGIDQWGDQTGCSCNYQAWGLDPHVSVPLASGQHNDHGKFTMLSVKTSLCGAGSLTTASKDIFFTDAVVPAGSTIHSIHVYMYGSFTGDNVTGCTVTAYLNGVAVAVTDNSGYNYCPTQPCLGFGDPVIPSNYPNGLDFFHPGAQNKLTITVVTDRPGDPYCGQAGVDIDMVEISGSYDLPPGIKTVSYSTVLPDQYPIGANGGDNGGGLMFIPERPASAPAGNAPQYQILELVADTTLPVNTNVWFRCYDPDDPTANGSPIDPNDDAAPNSPCDNVDGKGNLGSGQPIGALARLGTTQTSTSSFKVSAQVKKVGSGPTAKYQAIAFVRVPMGPGDNIIVAASVDSTEIDGLTLNGQKLQTASGYGLPTHNSTASDVLFTWRQLRIETDAMGTVSGNNQIGPIASAEMKTGNRLFFKFSVDDPINPAPAVFGSYRGWANSVDAPDTIYIHDRGTVLQARMPGINEPDLPADAGVTAVYLIVDNPPDPYPTMNLTGITVTVNDDDDINFVSSNTANEHEAMPAPDLTFLQNSTSSSYNLLAPAFVLPILAPSGNEVNLNFLLNASNTEITGQGSFANAPMNQSGFWVIRMMTSFQSPVDTDCDGNNGFAPQTDSGTLGVTGGTVILRLENIHELEMKTINRKDITDLFRPTIQPSAGAAVAGVVLTFGPARPDEDFVHLFTDPKNVQLPLPNGLTLAGDTIYDIRHAMMPMSN